MRLLAISISLHLARMTLAHREDYIDETLVFQTVQNSMQSSRNIGLTMALDQELISSGTMSRSNTGITSHLMLDGRLTVDDPNNDNANFDSARLEIRSRFAEEEDWPIMSQCPPKQTRAI